jgi:hypothetical protein
LNSTSEEETTYTNARHCFAQATLATLKMLTTRQKVIEKYKAMAQRLLLHGINVNVKDVIQVGSTQASYSTMVCASASRLSQKHAQVQVVALEGSAHSPPEPVVVVWTVN